MAYIILAERQVSEEIRATTMYLEQRGHQVDIATDHDAVLSLLNLHLPDVIVVSGMLKDTDIMEIIDDLGKIDPNRTTRVIMITVPDNTIPVSPLAIWTNASIDAYIVRPYSSYQMVVCIEQLIYRRVIFPQTALLELRLIKLTSAILFFAKQNGGRLPQMNKIDILKEILIPQFASEFAFINPMTNDGLLCNVNLSEKIWSEMRQPESIIAFYEQHPDSDGRRRVSLLGRSVEVPQPISKKFTDKEWTEALR